MRARIMRKILMALFVAAWTFVTFEASAALEEGFKNPPQEQYGLRCCCWWWLNSHVDKAGITRDLEAMKDKGFSGAMIFDAGGADHWNNNPIPAGPLFGSPEWIELFVHALQEADRLGLELGMSIQSGWNLGAPGLPAEHVAKQVQCEEFEVAGPTKLERNMPERPGAAAEGHGQFRRRRARSGTRD